jgi:hypothetical protein
LNWLLNKEYVRLKLIPDSSVRNWRAEDLAKTIAEQFKLPIERIVSEGLRIKGYKVQERAGFEIAFQDGSVTFYLTVPKHIAPLVVRRLQSIWDRATFEETTFAKPFDSNMSTVYELVYKKHDMYSLHTDAKNNLPLISLIESGRLLGEGERASVFAYLEPINQISWNYKMQQAWEILRSGKLPMRAQLTVRVVIYMIVSGLASILQEIMAAMSDVLSSGRGNNIYLNKPAIAPEASQYAIDRLSESTKRKAAKAGMKAYVWTMAQSKNESRADLVARSLAVSYSDLAEDNELEPRRLGKKQRAEVLRVVASSQPPKINLRYNLMSSAEAGKLLQLPGLELQEAFKEIERVEQAQLEVANKRFLDPTGILIGDVTFKGKTQKVYQPIHDDDELCLPHVGVGGMGQGKTKGLLSNYAVEATRAGFAALTIDAAKGEIFEQVSAVLPPEQVNHIDLGKTVFALDFCEAMHDDRARSRLANIVVYFFDVAEETTGQTERFLRACVLAMQHGRLSEVLSILNMNKDNKEAEKRLDEAIQRLIDRDDEFNLATLKEFKSYDTGMRRKILSPILNRMNDILGDEHLAKCMKADNSLDFVEIMSKRNLCTVIDVRADDLDKVAVNVIVSLLSLKIDLAMRMREKIKGPEASFPYFALIDEPHQYMKSTKIWEDAVVESRKWRVCYFWTFHYFDQLPAKLQKAIKNALPHYHLYPTSTETFKSLLQEIRPFVLDDALKLKRWHAINVIRSGGENATPFIAHMAAPPKDRLKSGA